MALSDYGTALVTGASSGIGAACVRALRARDLRVVATARRQERLAALAEETGCETLALDVSDTEAVYDRLGGEEIDVLINNAGLGRGFEGFLTSSAAEIDEVIRVNVAAAIHVVRVLAEGMVARRRGHIVNIGSVAGLYPLGFPVYGASKGAIHLFAQHLRLDLKGSGVRMTEICPGRVETEFFDSAFRTPGDRDRYLSDFELLKSSDIADAILFALDAPWRMNVTTIELTPTEQVQGGSAVMPVERG